jgi:CrcB protein
MRVVLATGFCGGYTTFSTAMVDTVRLARAGRYVAAVSHAVGTLTVSVAAVALGAWLVTALRR